MKLQKIGITSLLVFALLLFAPTALAAGVVPGTPGTAPFTDSTPQAFDLENNAAFDVENIAVVGSPASFDVTVTGTTASAGSTNDSSVTIAPKAGAVSGASETITITGTEPVGGSNGSVTWIINATYNPAPAPTTTTVTLTPAAPTVSATEGYAAASAPITEFTVKNTGSLNTGAMTVALGGTNPGSFTLSATSLTDTVPNGTPTFTVKPNTGLTAGTYTATVTVSNGAGGVLAAPVSATITFTVSSPTAAALQFQTTSGALLTSYRLDDYLPSNPSYLTFRVRNTGTTAATNVTVSHSNTTHYEFISSTATTVNSLAGGAYLEYAIRPRTSVAAGGTYYDTITVTGNGGALSASFTLSGTAVYSLDSSSSYNYISRTLTNSGVRVSGSSINSSAVLTVTENALHDTGTCAACRKIAAYNTNGNTLRICNISMSRGFTGSVSVAMQVPNSYNGYQVSMLHCDGGILSNKTVTVQSGYATATYTSLSPFAVLNGVYTDTTTESPIIDPPKSGDWDAYASAGGVAVCAGLLLYCAIGIVKSAKRKRAL